MKLVVFSDSHGDTETMHRVLAQEQPDGCVFLGDGYRDICAVKACFPRIVFHIIAGNCDRCQAPLCLCIPLDGGHRIFAAHGHEYGVKYDPALLRLRYAALEQGADIALFGHTHSPLLDEDEGFRVMNPGSVGNRFAPGYGVIRADANGLRLQLKTAGERSVV